MDGWPEGAETAHTHDDKEKGEGEREWTQAAAYATLQLAAASVALPRLRSDASDARLDTSLLSRSVAAAQR
jgi:hypothetical protein